MRFFRSVLTAGILSATFILALSAADIPRPVPATTFRTPNGGVIDLAQYKGKVVALEFLITTCPHCQKCSVVMQKLYKELGPKGFQPVGIATNEMAHMLVPDYVKKFALTFPVGFTEYKTAVDWLQHPPMLTMYMPQVVMIDKKGIIRMHHPG